MQISRVAVEQLPDVWPAIAPSIARGLRRGAGDSTSAAELQAAIQEGRMQLWLVHDDADIIASVIVQVASRPFGLAVRVVLVAGRDFHRWVGRLMQLLDDYRLLIGAARIEACARPGMAKWLQERGWRRKAVLMDWKGSS